MEVGSLLMFLMLACQNLTAGGRCALPALSNSNIFNHQCVFKNRGIRSVREMSIHSDCTYLDFSGNLLTTLEDFVFVNLTDLLTLDLSHNRIVNLNSNCFHGLSKLECLTLGNNKLNFTDDAYPESVFSPLIKLKTLDIGGNTNLFQSSSVASGYPDKAIGTLSSLEDLTIDMFSQFVFGVGFAKLKRLKTLIANPVNSSLGTVSNETFRVFQDLNVSSLVLSAAGITKIDKMAFSYFRYLTQLSLRGNFKLGLQNAVSSLSSLHGAPLSDIDVSEVNSDKTDFQDQVISHKIVETFKPFCMRKFDFSDNRIVCMPPSAVYHFNSSCLEYLAMNNFYLSTQTIVLLFTVAGRFRRLRHFEASGWVYPGISNDNHKYVRKTISPLKRNITKPMPPNVEFVNCSRTFFSCNPTDRITFENASRLRILDISYSGMSGCFERRTFGLETVSILVISGNDYSNSLSSAFMSSFPNVTKLVASDTSLMAAFKKQSSIFSPLIKLHHLDIGNSELTRIPASAFNNLEDLRILDVSGNKLVHIPDCICTLLNLQLLDLRNNALRTVSKRERARFNLLVHTSKNFTLNLDGNPLVCNCNTYDFVEWVWTSTVTFDNNGNYSCIASDGSAVSLLNLRENFRDLQVQCVSSFWVTFSSLAASILIVILLVSSVGYRCRIPIKYWCHTVCRKPAAKPSQRHKYDALVAYCHQDYRWVCQTLYRKLTDSNEDTGYKLCVYDRDFLPGIPIEENIISAINDSFKIILVISPAFVQSVWCQFELQMVRMKMAQEGRVDVVIPIILKDVPVSLMPKSLLNLWNTSVFLVWSDSPGEQRHFWSNLLMALGPIRVNGELQADQGDEERDDCCEKDAQIPKL